MLAKIVLELMRSTLTHVIKMKCAYMSVFFFLNFKMKFFKFLKCTRIIFKQVNPTHPSIIRIMIYLFPREKYLGK